MRSRFLRGTCIATLAAGVLLASAAPVVAGPTADAPSSGWNDWTCRPSADHPEPVVLLHGLGGGGDWTDMGPHLAGAGHCVFSLTYGQGPWYCPGGGTGPIAQSAQQIATFMDDVRATTGATKVDLVGHSEGALLALYIPKVLGRAPEVDTVVALGFDEGGPKAGGVPEVVDLLGARPLLVEVSRQFQCQGYTDALPGSAIRNELSAGPMAQPGVSYTVINTRYDALDLVLTPSGSIAQEPGMQHIWVQDVCPLDLVGHIFMPSSPSVMSLVKNALDPAHTTPVTCGIGLPL